MNTQSKTKEHSLAHQLATTVLWASPMIAATAMVMVMLFAYLPEWAGQASWALFGIVVVKLIYQKHHWQQTLVLLMLPVMPAGLVIYAFDIPSIMEMFKSQVGSWLFAVYYLLMTACVAYDAWEKYHSKYGTEKCTKF
ncbi:hypothetical protein SAMN02744133_10865 [Thalassospira xiamenensis M-5 = DSM 17429]|uniref:Transmembrane protein n=1 Tax=Thalassospira xiamenensis M-5 = DSM 17429 TaxID=1123366 RepID=A0AB72UJ67_9PROT|nr:hypothetical protein [Thalassospira xiamenensis]AJD54343.1 hypothetical protein TH3_21353 [Thalassospira xiamenensis M-5 = DSM 17429]SIT21346.1 hypothetical protein SAMN02744133_10865 [Thalassospira xiamenensis M-5 = DSM 17429]